MLHIFLGHEYVFSDSFHLHLTLRGIERIHHHVPHRAKPITPAILLSIQTLSHTFTALQSSVFSCGLLLFFTMARAGSILPTSMHTPTHHFLTQDRVHLTKEGILVTLIHTKNIQFGRRRLHIPLLRSHSPICPVAAYIASQAAHSATQAIPAFTYMEAGKLRWLTKSTFISVFRQLLKTSGTSDHTAYTGHSFRRGGASWAFQSGMPGELIQISGDWSSDAYKNYLEFTMQNKMDLAALLIKDLPHWTSLVWPFFWRFEKFFQILQCLSPPFMVEKILSLSA